MEKEKKTKDIVGSLFYNNIDIVIKISFSIFKI